jgi:hydrogenase maturation protease
MTQRLLVAGVGNIFLSDDGFGVEVARRLRELELPAHVEVADVGVRGVDLAYRLLDGYAACILVDACARGGEPGTVYRIDALGAPADEPAGGLAFDGHRMTPDTVLALLGTLSAGTGATPPRAIEVVGCEPAEIGEGMGLSAPVAAAVPQAVRLILRMIESGLGHRSEQDVSHDHSQEDASHDRSQDHRQGKRGVHSHPTGAAHDAQSAGAAYDAPASAPHDAPIDVAHGAPAPAQTGAY